MKKSRIVVHLSLEDLRDLGVIRKIYKRRKSIANAKKETYDFGFKNNPDPNLYNKQYPNYFQNSSNLQNENTRLQNDKLTQEINTLHQGFNNNNEMDNKIRHLEGFEKRALNYLENLRPEESRFQELDEYPFNESDEYNNDDSDNFHSQENDFNSPGVINSSKIHSEENGTVSSIINTPVTPKRIDDGRSPNNSGGIDDVSTMSDEIKNELKNVIPLGSTEKIRNAFISPIRTRSKTKMNLLSDDDRKKPPDDKEDTTEEPTQSKNKRQHEELNKQLIAAGITDTNILNSKRQEDKKKVLNKIIRNDLVEKYHLLGGNKSTNKKAVDEIKKLIDFQILQLSNPTEKQQNIILAYNNNE